MIPATDEGREFSLRARRKDKLLFNADAGKQAMTTRQEKTLQDMGHGESTPLRLESDDLDGREIRSARAAELNWHPEREIMHRRSTIGGIAPPGSAISVTRSLHEATAAMQTKAFQTVSTHSQRRSATSARRSRVLFTLLPLLLLAVWVWYWLCRQ